MSIEISQPWFGLIRSGKKTIEGRLNKGKYHVGDILTVTCTGQPEQPSYTVMVTDIREYNDFDKMLRVEKLKNCLPDPAVRTYKDGVSIYAQYFTKDQIKTHGVIAMQLKIQSR